MADSAGERISIRQKSLGIPPAQLAWVGGAANLGNILVAALQLVGGIGIKIQAVLNASRVRSPSRLCFWLVVLHMRIALFGAPFRLTC